MVVAVAVVAPVQAVLVLLGEPEAVGKVVRHKIMTQ